MSDHKKVLDACLRALDGADKALARGDFGSALDWWQAALSGFIRLAEDTGDIPKNRRPRRLRSNNGSGD